MGRRGSNVSKAILKEKAVVLRAQGFSFPKIAATLGIGVSTAHDYITQALKELRCRTDLTTEEYREMELQRCDANFGKLADIEEQIESSAMASGDKLLLRLRTIDRVGNVQSKVISLRGLEAPQKVEHSGTFDLNVLREAASKYNDRPDDPEETMGVVS